MTEFERAMEAVFGERAVEFSSEARRLMRLLYSEGIKDGRQIERNNAVNLQQHLVNIDLEPKRLEELTLEGITAAAKLLDEVGPWPQRPQEFAATNYNPDILQKLLDHGLAKLAPMAEPSGPFEVTFPLWDSTPATPKFEPPKFGASFFKHPSFEIHSDWHPADFYLPKKKGL